jgi:hypothetical protein
MHERPHPTPTPLKNTKILFAKLPLETVWKIRKGSTLWGPKSRQNEARSAPITALCYQNHAIQTPPAIFQTVSLGTSVNKPLRCTQNARHRFTGAGPYSPKCLEVPNYRKFTNPHLWALWGAVAKR